jgi:hypothetical protein
VEARWLDSRIRRASGEFEAILASRNRVDEQRILEEFPAP